MTEEWTQHSLGFWWKRTEDQFWVIGSFEQLSDGTFQAFIGQTPVK